MSEVFVMTSVIKTVIKEMKLKYPNYKFVVKRNSYNSLLILDIKPVDKTEEFAYYGGDDCGYVVCNTVYRQIYNDFRTHSDIVNNSIRVLDFIADSKTMELEFK
jgi:hypothetical protein